MTPGTSEEKPEFHSHYNTIDPIYDNRYLQSIAPISMGFQQPDLMSFRTTILSLTSASLRRERSIRGRSTWKVKCAPLAIPEHDPSEI